MPSIILNQSLISGDNNPYLTIKELLDIANFRVNNINNTKITQGLQIQILRMLRNEYMLNTIYNRLIKEITTDSTKTEYILDLYNMSSIEKVTYQDKLLNYLQPDLFDNLIVDSQQLTEDTSNILIFTIRQSNAFYWQLEFKPTIVTSGETIKVYYFSAGNEPIVTDPLTLNSYIEIPNQLFAYFVDSLTFKFMLELPNNDIFKANINYYNKRHEQGLDAFKIFIESTKLKSNVGLIEYPQNLKNGETVSWLK